MTRRLLEDIKIADFTWALVGPITTKVFSDYGAQVIKVEGRSRPDSRRIAAPFKDNIPGLNRSCTYNPYNTGKLSLALNLAEPRGIAVAKKLVAWADIVVDNFAGGAMKRMGLGYEELKSIKPEIIMLSSCPMGQTGPYPTAPGIGAHMTALSGFNHLTGWPDREPAGLDSYTDFISPQFNALALLAALDYRRRTGKGQYLDLSQYEDCVHFMSPLILEFEVNGRVGNRMGNRSEAAAPHGVYQCQGDDRWCAIAVSTDTEWRDLVGVLGRSDLAGNPKFSTVVNRKENEDELDQIVGSWTINFPAEEVMTKLQAAGVSAGVVQTAPEMLDQDPQLRHRHFFEELDHPEVGMYRAPRPPFILSKAPSEVKRSPLLGEHNEFVLKQILKMSDDEIAELLVDGVVE